MKHFSLEEWADFARQVAPSEDRGQMQRHLDSGCSKCLQIVDLWRSVAALARAESAYEPPSEAVRFIKNAYRGSEPKRSLPKTLPARLIFDSFIHPLPAGFRSSPGAARQILYSCEHWLIDLHLEGRPECGQVCVTGQVQDSHNPEKMICGAQVRLVSEGRILAQTVTNELGEFQLVLFEEGVNPTLWVICEGRAAMVVAPLLER